MKGSWITGFVDGEGCFHVGIRKRSKMKVGLEIGLSFSITQKRSERIVLEKIQEYFGCGGIKYSSRDDCYTYSVKALKDIKVILKHFKEYPLETTKKESYEVFKEIYGQIMRKEHLNAELLKEIVEKSYSMNKSGKRKKSKEHYLKKIISKEKKDPKVRVS